MPKGVYKRVKPLRRTPETKRRISAALKGRSLTPEHRAAIKSAALMTNRPLMGNRHYRWNFKGWTTYGNRYYVRIVTGWVRHSRAVWVRHHGPIPPGHEVHHADGDIFNDSLENLRCWTKVKHMRHHRTKKPRKSHLGTRQRQPCQSHPACPCQPMK